MNCVANHEAAKNRDASAPSMASHSDASSTVTTLTASVAAKAVAASEKCKALQQRQAEAQMKGKPAWDTSTCVGDRGDVGVQQKCRGEGCQPELGPGCHLATTMADIFRENPEFKHLHSARSLKVLFEQSASCENRGGFAVGVESEPVLLSL